MSIYTVKRKFPVKFLGKFPSFMQNVSPSECSYKTLALAYNYTRILRQKARQPSYYVYASLWLSVSSVSFKII
jgi:hypothetical protein